MIPTLDKALELLSKEKDPQVKICSSSAYWIPLQWLYDKMVINKDLEPLQNIDPAEKQRLWKIAKEQRPDKNNISDRWVLVMVCHDLHVYEKVK